MPRPDNVDSEPEKMDESGSSDNSSDLPVSAPSLPVQGRVFLLLTSAGSSARFGDGKKEFVKIEGKTVLDHALNAFLVAQSLDAVVITHPREMRNDTEIALSDEVAQRARSLPLGLFFCEGGETRQESVYNGLCVLEELTTRAQVDAENAIVLIHDAARPWISAQTIRDVVQSVRRHGACVPLCDLADTPKVVAEPPFVAGHPPRDSIKAAQTPQGFALGALLRANRAARADGRLFTDDAALWASYVGPVAFVHGDRKNRKITYREDLPEGSHSASPTLWRIGQGLDIHRLVSGRPLILGGVHIDWPYGELGHSDGDVLLHALIDAMLGACALGDIGTYFPPDNPEWQDADSSLLARKAAELLRQQGWRILNLDSTVILEKPKLAPYRDLIRKNLADIFGLKLESVSFKAKTKEGLDAVGRGEAVEAQAVVMVVHDLARDPRSSDSF